MFWLLRSCFSSSSLNVWMIRVPGQRTVSILSMNSSATRSAKRLMPSTLPSLWQAMLFRISFSSIWSNISPIPMAFTSTLGSLIQAKTQNGIFYALLHKPLILCFRVIFHCQEPAQVGEQRIIVSGVKASVCNDHHSDVGFGSAAVPDQVVIGVLQGGWSPRSTSDPFQLLHGFLNKREACSRHPVYVPNFTH